jgi:hypothetical protein
LKVGIAGDLQRRLTQHWQSRQSRLKSAAPEPWTHPNQVISKGSILAKHLYFDSSITDRFDLRREKDRVDFIEQECRVRVLVTLTREEARTREREMELVGRYRYYGAVQVR